MKQLSLSILILLAATAVANAQTGTFFEAGVSGSYGSNRPMDREKGGPDFYGALGFKVFEFRGSTIQARARGKLSREAELADLFARDNNPERQPTGELFFSPEARWNLSIESHFKPFVAAGVEYRRQFGLEGAPYSSLNPTLTFGTRVGYGYEVFYTRLYDDRLNRSGFPVQTIPGVITARNESSLLRGDRLGVSYLFRIRGKLHFKFGAEGDYVNYRACSNVACDAYRERDWTVRPFVVISIF